MGSLIYTWEKRSKLEKVGRKRDYEPTANYTREEEPIISW
jgi:hypothetical protein